MVAQSPRPLENIQMPDVKEIERPKRDHPFCFV
jgi:hypothetical protein